MKKTLHKILIGLIVLLLFPVVLFTVYEYTKVTDDEELIDTVYKNQLETIVSSINSYSQDVAGNWASRIELWLEYRADSATINRLVKENPAITGIYLAQNNQVHPIYVSPGVACSSQTIETILKVESTNIIQITEYFKNSYRKFLSYSIDNNNVVLYFICGSKDDKPVVCFININLQQFLQSYINPRMQSIAQDNFVIAFFLESSDMVLLSTEKKLTKKMIFDKEGEMWLFSDIKIGISLKKQTITDLANKRMNEGLLLVGIVFVVLLGGIWFLYISVKREIQLAQIKSEFISNVSHEIRTPLALISMYVETLEMNRVKTAEKISEYYGIISKETQRLTVIVNQILSFSKLESGKRQFSFKRCDLNRVIDKVLETYQFHTSNKGFTLNFQPCDKLPALNCDSESVGEAIVNLIDNAMKYSKDKKQIDITTGIHKNYTFVEVKDYGMGIAPKDQKMVFDKFYRVTNDNLANEVKGTGLGLSIVSEIVKAHRGKISLQSKADEGSVFRLSFPIVKDEIKL